MYYFFVLGNNPAMSVAEILSIFKSAEVLFLNEEILVLDLEQEINATEAIAKMGGTIKIGRILSELKSSDTKVVIKELKKLVDIKDHQGKFKFGFSFYGRGQINTRVLGMELKKHLKENGISARWVVSRDKNLSSVVVETNKLVDQGWEIVLLKTEYGFCVGRTLAVQPFKELSFRDYGRPARDDYSGMLPPKLAQIMINLAQVKTSDTILDPFCGSGTILTEAMLMDHENLIGSDISQKAIDDTKKNIEWTADKYKVSSIKYQVLNKDVRDLVKILKPNTIDAIITEPYLGPQRGKVDYLVIKKELEKLYSDSLVAFKKILKSEGKIVMVWPVFFGAGNPIFLNPNLADLQIVSPLPDSILKNKFLNLSFRKTIVYHREGQKVGREIVILSS